VNFALNWLSRAEFRFFVAKLPQMVVLHLTDGNHFNYRRMAISQAVGSLVQRLVSDVHPIAAANKII